MKRLILIAFALVGSLCGYSQMIEYPKHQVSAFYCDGQSLYSALLDFWGGGPSEDGKKDDGKEHLEYTGFSGTYNIEYLQNIIKPWMSMGVQLGYEENSSKHWISRYDSPSQPNDKWTEKERTPYIMAVFQFDLLRHDWIGLYTKAGEGIRFIFTEQNYESGKKDKDFGLVLCFVEVVGLEVGPKNVRVFGEVGLGAQGFASIGIRGRF